MGNKVGNEGSGDSQKQINLEQQKAQANHPGNGRLNAEANGRTNKPTANSDGGAKAEKDYKSVYVKEGDTLWHVSRAYNAPLTAIYAANPKYLPTRDCGTHTYKPHYPGNQYYRVPMTAERQKAETANFYSMMADIDRKNGCLTKDSQVKPGKASSTHAPAEKTAGNGGKTDSSKVETKPNGKGHEQPGSDGKVNAAQSTVKDGPDEKQRAGAIDALKKELHKQFAIQQELYKNYSKTIREHSGPLGTIANMLQNSFIATSSKDSNPIAAFWGTHVCNKDEGTDGTDKAIQQKSDDNIKHINEIQKEIKRLEKEQGSTWTADFKESVRHIDQIQANAVAIDEKIGRYAEGKKGMEDGIADTAAFTVGVVFAEMPGVNVALGAATKVILKGGDAVLAGRSYHGRDALYDAGTGALSAFAIGKGLQAGRVVTTAAVKGKAGAFGIEVTWKGLNKLGYKVLPGRISNSIALKGEQTLSKKLIGIGVTAVIKEGAIGMTTGFVQSSVTNTVGGLYDASQGKDARVGDRLLNVAASSVGGYVLGAGLGGGGRLVGEGLGKSVHWANETKTGKAINNSPLGKTVETFKPSEVIESVKGKLFKPKDNTAGTTGGAAGGAKAGDAGQAAAQHQQPVDNGQAAAAHQAQTDKDNFKLPVADYNDMKQALIPLDGNVATRKALEEAILAQEEISDEIVQRAEVEINGYQFLTVVGSPEFMSGLEQSLAGNKLLNSAIMSGVETINANQANAAASGSAQTTGDQTTHTNGHKDGGQAAAQHQQPVDNTQAAAQQSASGNDKSTEHSLNLPRFEDENGKIRVRVPLDADPATAESIANAIKAHVKSTGEAAKVITKELDGKHFVDVIGSTKFMDGFEQALSSNAQVKSAIESELAGWQAADRQASAVSDAQANPVTDNASKSASEAAKESSESSKINWNMLEAKDGDHVVVTLPALSESEGLASLHDIIDTVRSLKPENKDLHLTPSKPGASIATLTGTKEAVTQVKEAIQNNPELSSSIKSLESTPTYINRLKVKQNRLLKEGYSPATNHEAAPAPIEAPKDLFWDSPLGQKVNEFKVKYPQLNNIADDAKIVYSNDGTFGVERVDGKADGKITKLIMPEAAADDTQAEAKQIAHAIKAAFGADTTTPAADATAQPAEAATESNKPTASKKVWEAAGKVWNKLQQPIFSKAKSAETATAETEAKPVETTTAETKANPAETTTAETTAKPAETATAETTAKPADNADPATSESAKPKRKGLLANLEEINKQKEAKLKKGAPAKPESPKSEQSDDNKYDPEIQEKIAAGQKARREGGTETEATKQANELMMAKVPELVNKNNQLIVNTFEDFKGGAQTAPADVKSTAVDHLKTTRQVFSDGTKYVENANGIYGNKSDPVKRLMFKDGSTLDFFKSDNPSNIECELTLKDQKTKFTWKADSKEPQENIAGKNADKKDELIQSAKDYKAQLDSLIPSPDKAIATAIKEADVRSVGEITNVTSKNDNSTFSVTTEITPSTATHTREQIELKQMLTLTGKLEKLDQSPIAITHKTTPGANGAETHTFTFNGQSEAVLSLRDRLEVIKAGATPPVAPERLKIQLYTSDAAPTGQAGTVEQPSKVYALVPIMGNTEAENLLVAAITKANAAKGSADEILFEKHGLSDTDVSTTQAIDLSGPKQLVDQVIDSLSKNAKTNKLFDTLAKESASKPGRADEILASNQKKANLRQLTEAELNPPVKAAESGSSSVSYDDGGQADKEPEQAPNFDHLKDVLDKSQSLERAEHIALMATNYPDQLKFFVEISGKFKAEKELQMAKLKGILAGDGEDITIRFDKGNGKEYPSGYWFTGKAEAIRELAKTLAEHQKTSGIWHDLIESQAAKDLKAANELQAAKDAMAAKQPKAAEQAVVEVQQQAAPAAPVVEVQQQAAPAAPVVEVQQQAAPAAPVVEVQQQAAPAAPVVEVQQQAAPAAPVVEVQQQAAPADPADPVVEVQQQAAPAAPVVEVQQQAAPAAPVVEVQQQAAPAAPVVEVQQQAAPAAPVVEVKQEAPAEEKPEASTKASKKAAKAKARAAKKAAADPAEEVKQLLDPAAPVAEVQQQAAPAAPVAEVQQQAAPAAPVVEVQQQAAPAAPVAEVQQQAAPAAPVVEVQQQAAPAAPVVEVQQQAAPAAPVAEVQQQAAPAAPVVEVQQQAAPAAPVAEVQQQAAPAAPVVEVQQQAAPAAPVVEVQQQAAPAAPEADSKQIDFKKLVADSAKTDKVVEKTEITKRTIGDTQVRDYPKGQSEFTVFFEGQDGKALPTAKFRDAVLKFAADSKQLVIDNKQGSLKTTLVPNKAGSTKPEDAIGIRFRGDKATINGLVPVVEDTFTKRTLSGFELKTLESGEKQMSIWSGKKGEFVANRQDFLNSLKDKLEQQGIKFTIGEPYKTEAGERFVPVTGEYKALQKVARATKDFVDSEKKAAKDAPKAAEPKEAVENTDPGKLNGFKVQTLDDGTQKVDFRYTRNGEDIAARVTFFEQLKSKLGLKDEAVTITPANEKGDRSIEFTGDATVMNQVTKATREFFRAKDNAKAVDNALLKQLGRGDSKLINDIPVTSEPKTGNLQMKVYIGKGGRLRDSYSKFYDSMPEDLRNKFTIAEGNPDKNGGVNLLVTTKEAKDLATVREVTQRTEAYKKSVLEGKNKTVETRVARVDTPVIEPVTRDMLPTGGQSHGYSIVFDDTKADAHLKVEDADQHFVGTRKQKTALNLEAKKVSPSLKTDGDGIIRSTNPNAKARVDELEAMAEHLKGLKDERQAVRDAEAKTIADDLADKQQKANAQLEANKRVEALNQAKSTAQAIEKETGFETAVDETTNKTEIRIPTIDGKGFESQVQEVVKVLQELYPNKLSSKVENGSIVIEADHDIAAEAAKEIRGYDKLKEVFDTFAAQPADTQAAVANNATPETHVDSTTATVNDSTATTTTAAVADANAGTETIAATADATVKVEEATHSESQLKDTQPTPSEVTEVIKGSGIKMLSYADHDSRELDIPVFGNANFAEKVANKAVEFGPVSVIADQDGNPISVRVSELRPDSHAEDCAEKVFNLNQRVFTSNGQSLEKPVSAKTEVTAAVKDTVKTESEAVALEPAQIERLERLKIAISEDKKGNPVIEIPLDNGGAGIAQINLVKNVLRENGLQPENITTDMNAIKVRPGSNAETIADQIAQRIEAKQGTEGGAEKK